VSNTRLWLGLGVAVAGALIATWVWSVPLSGPGSWPATPLLLVLFLSWVLIAVGGALIVTWSALRSRTQRRMEGEVEIDHATAYAQPGLTQMYPRRPPAR